MNEYWYLVTMPYYRYHVFFCTNLRADGSACCQRFNALALRDYAKKRSKALGITGAGGVRINTAGCLDLSNRTRVEPKCAAEDRDVPIIWLGNLFARG